MDASRVRSLAKSKGYRLQSRNGMYILTEAATGCVVMGTGYSAWLEEAAEWIEGMPSIVEDAGHRDPGP